MNRKMIGRLIVGLLVLATMITGGCAKEETTPSTPKLNISIKIETSTHRWRVEEQPFDIYSAVKEELEEAGFDIVPPESTDYDFLLSVKYTESKGGLYSPTGTISPDISRGTDITCELRLYDKTQDLIFEQAIAATTSSEAVNLYASAVYNFKGKAYFRYLGEIIAGKFADAKALEPLIQALENENGTVQQETAWALGEIGDARAVEPLIQALNDEESSVREEAAEALGKIGDTRAVEPLIQALNDEEYSVQWEAAEALGEIGDARAVEALIQALENEYWNFRRIVVEVLGEIGDARAAEPLVELLKEIVDVQTVESLEESQAIGRVREAVKEALVKIGESSVEPLIQALEDENEWARIEVARTLGKIGDASAVEALIQALNDEDETVRQEAARALGKIGDTRAIEPLLEALKDESEWVREAAQEALQKIRGY